jgi:hypothetical protein
LPITAKAERESYHSRQNALKNGTQNVEDIAKKPDNDKLNRESIGTAALEVLDNLRREDNDYLRSVLFNR